MKFMFLTKAHIPYHYIHKHFTLRRIHNSLIFVLILFCIQPTNGKTLTVIPGKYKIQFWCLLFHIARMRGCEGWKCGITLFEHTIDRHMILHFYVHSPHQKNTSIICVSLYAAVHVTSIIVLASPAWSFTWWVWLPSMPSFNQTQCMCEHVWVCWVMLLKVLK